MEKIVLLLILSAFLLLSFWFIFVKSDYGATYKKYGKQIIYYDFSKIPNDLVLDRKIKLPKDLREFIKDEHNNPKIENPTRFEQEIWQEAHELGYTFDKFKNASVKEAIGASVEIVVSRLTYFLVDDEDKEFIKKHGAFRSLDYYFHWKSGDCDKYRDATIGVFNIIKKLNPDLKNVYLSQSSLGGNNFRPHAWVAIVIPQNDCLVLSHIDPTFYDNGNSLEATDFHICFEYNIFIAYFYHALHGYKNYRHAYRFLNEAFFKAENKEWQEQILNDMSFALLQISHYKPMIAAKEIQWVVGAYDLLEFSKNLDTVF